MGVRSSSRRRSFVLERLEPRNLFATTLPTGWTDANIGAPLKTGSAAYNAGTWTVSGSGSDIWNSSDQFNFTSEHFTGNGSIVAKVNSLANSNSYSKAGVMFRNDTTATSAFADVIATPGQGVNFQWR